MSASMTGTTKNHCDCETNPICSGNCIALHCVLVTAGSILSTALRNIHAFIANCQRLRCTCPKWIHSLSNAYSRRRLG
jgi:hypothetical protein